jgi:hypothetical protein
MTADISKELYEFCARAYRATTSREAFSYPDWIASLKRDADAARVAHVCVQSAVLSMMKNPDINGQLDGVPFVNGVLPADYLSTLFMVRKLSESGSGPAELLAPALFGLSEYLRFEGGFDSLSRWSPGGGTPNPLHALATEASGRSAAAVTPLDVVQFMMQQAQATQVHVYSLDCLGLLYGVNSIEQAWPVGNEFRTDSEYVCPAPLVHTLEDSRVRFDAPEFANRVFLDLEQTVRRSNPKPEALHANAVSHELPFFPSARGEDDEELRFDAPESAKRVFLDLEQTVRRSNPKPEALLVNAARQELPFYPSARGEDDEDLSPDAGLLNVCLKAGYERVVVLVSNHYLTAGRGRAEKILRHCLQHGLLKVIQLPMGLLGLRSQAHSLLVFGRAPNHDQVEFVDLMDDELTVSPAKGFGQPRRARQLKFGSAVQPAQKNLVSVQTLLEKKQGQGRAKARKLLSFEVGQFSQVDALAAVRGRYEFMRLGAFMEVFRSHHIAETGEVQRTHYSEIGANNISAEGWISLGKLKDCPVDSLERRQAQVLKDEDLIVCFRGSPDSYGKVGIYRHQPGDQAVPNQSFVILRRKADAPENAPSPAVVMWWLKSQYGQSYLQQKAIAPDVMRVAPRDIDALEVPCGPTALLDEEIKRLMRAEIASQKINELRTEVASLLAQAWTL